MRQVVFDLETTGFRFDEGHRIVEIGGVEMVRGAVTGRSFHTYVNPERDMPEGAFKVHGLSEKFLKGFPVFADERVAGAFVEFVGDAELIAHNGIAFDLPFINAELAHAGLEPLTNDIIDTLALARRKFPGAPASLDALCARFGVDMRERERDGHGALLDSRLLAAVYIELTGGLQAGLDFAARPDGEGGPADRTSRRAVYVRPAPLAPLITGDEAAAHARFVETELGPNALWGDRLKPPSGV
ncbi:MAG: DNA polymerase III subunit epsilon [Parvularculaceae bacterium]|nr:DNA polymerase III subunit epsilon [Parvularculaceae bacterium]